MNLMPMRLEVRAQTSPLGIRYLLSQLVSYRLRRQNHVLVLPSLSKGTVAQEALSSLCFLWVLPGTR